MFFPTRRPSNCRTPLLRLLQMEALENRCIPSSVLSVDTVGLIETFDPLAGLMDQFAPVDRQKQAISLLAISLTPMQVPSVAGNDSDASAGSQSDSDPLSTEAYGGAICGAAARGGDFYGSTAYGGDAYGGDPYGGGSNHEPTTTGINDVSVDEDSANVTVNLHSAFDDAEDDDNELSYSVEENTNTALFDQVTMDSYGGLVLNFAENAFGVADLTVRATDTGGLMAEASFRVTVASIDDAPVITSFHGFQGSHYSWTLYGSVSDVDNAVQGDLVTFGGVLAGYQITATVGANGTFSLTESLPGLQGGVASAQAQGPDGLASNPVTTELIPS